MARTTKTMTVSLPAAMMEEIDRLCAEEYRTRSELVREAVRLYFVRTGARDATTTEASPRRRRSTVSK